MSNEGKKRESLLTTNESSFSVRAAIAASLLMTFSSISLGFFIHDRFQKFMRLPEETIYLELSSPIYLRSSELLPFSSNSKPSNVSLPRVEREDQVAPPNEVWHSMSDEELFRRALSVSKVIENPNNYNNSSSSSMTRKLAFMFLTRGKLPFSQLWEMFFKGHESLYSIYVHTSPDYNFEPLESSVFYNRRIPSQPVHWGGNTMVDAERRLLANALLENSNERFILLSESCIPIFDFSTIYTFLINSNKSFLGLFDDPRIMGRGRYNRKMWPTVSLAQWRKGSQWFEAHRRLATAIVSESRYYPVFAEHCRPPCYMDEHYFPTFVNIAYPPETTNRSLTWVDWSRGGSHPATISRGRVSKEFFEHLRRGFNCTYNGGFTTMCFLFARKFHPNALQPLLKLAPYLIGFNSSN